MTRDELREKEIRERMTPTGLALRELLAELEKGGVSSRDGMKIVRSAFKWCHRHDTSMDALLFLWHIREQAEAEFDALLK
jgi:hypothetical protein